MEEREALKIVRAILEREFELREKPYTGGRGREKSPVETGLLAAKVEKSLLNQLKRLGGSSRAHLELALRWYFRILEVEGKR